MAVPNPPVNGTIVDAVPMQANYTYLETLANSKVSAPVGNSSLANDNYEFTIVRILSATELVSVLNTRFGIGTVPFDSVDGSQQYRLISVSVMPMLAANRTTPMIVSVQSGTPSNAGGAAVWTNLVTGITVPVAAASPITSTTVGANFTTNTAANGLAGLSLIVTQAGVGFTGTDHAVISLKISRLNGLRST